MNYKKLTYLILPIISSFWMGVEAYAQTPEFDLKNIIQKIDNSTHYIKAIDQIDKKPITISKSLLPERVLKLIVQKYQENEWYVVTRLSDQYIAMSNIYDQQDLLDVYYMRAHAEQELGDARAAIRYYLKYLSVFITRPESSPKYLNSVFRKMVVIGNNISKGNIDDLKRLISSLAALKLSTNDRTELTFLNAMILAKQTDSFDDYSKEIALNWLDDVYKNQSHAYKRAKALYYSSIIYIKKGDLKKAEAKIKKILSEKNLEPGQMTDLAKISLARIYGAQNKLEQSYETYKSISKESSFYKDSLFEQIFILQRTKKYFEASQLASQLIKEYPSDPLSRQIKNTISQLYMVSGQTDKALQAIDEQKKYWTDLQAWFGQTYTAKAIDAEKVFKLNDKLNETGILVPPFSLKKHAEMFAKINDLKRRARDSRDEVRSMILNLGRVDFRTYMPEITGRGSQLKEAVKDLLHIGDELVSAETEVYRNKIPSFLKAALDVSIKRRANLFMPENQFTSERGNPLQVSRTLKANNRLVKLNERLADLSSILRFFVYRNQILEENRGVESDLLVDLRKRSREIENAILRGAEIVRSRSILNLQYSNPIRGVKRLLLAGLTQLHGDYTQLYRVRDEYKHINEKYIAYEIEDVWKKFDQMAVALFDVLQRAENEFNRSILSDVREFERLDAYYSKVIKELNENEQKLLAQLNDNFEYDFADIERQLVNQIAFQSKLGGDSNWYKFIGEEKKLNEIGAEYINEKGSVIRSSGYIDNEVQ